MKKLLFILFFPITLPIYLIYRFFEWLIDTFIPFVQYDVIPFFTDTLFPAIKRFINYIKEKSAEKKEKRNLKTVEHDFENATAYLEDVQITSNPTIHEVKSILDYNVFSANIDYSLYPLAESDDPLFIRALAVASYKEIFDAYTLQKELNISYDRAMLIINQLLDNKFISPFKDNMYFSNMSFGFFNTTLEKLLNDEIE